MLFRSSRLQTQLAMVSVLSLVLAACGAGAPPTADSLLLTDPQQELGLSRALDEAPTAAPLPLAYGPRTAGVVSLDEPSAAEWSTVQHPSEWGQCPSGFFVDFTAYPILSMVDSAVGWAYVSPEELASSAASYRSSADEGTLLSFDYSRTELVAGSQVGESIVIRPGEAVAWIFAASDAGAGLLVGLLTNAQPTQTLIAMFPDGSFVFLGACTRGMGDSLAARLSADGVQDGAEFVQRLVDGSSAEYERLVQLYDAESAGRVLPWSERDVWERQVDPESTPSEVLENLRPINLLLDLPEEWVDFGGSICVHTDLGWGECGPIDTWEFAPLLTVMVDTSSDVELWLMDSDSPFPSDRLVSLVTVPFDTLYRIVSSTDGRGLVVTAATDADSMLDLAGRAIDRPVLGFAEIDLESIEAILGERSQQATSASDE